MYTLQNTHHHNGYPILRQVLLYEWSMCFMCRVMPSDWGVLEGRTWLRWSWGLIPELPHSDGVIDHKNTACFWWGHPRGTLNLREDSIRKLLESHEILLSGKSKISTGLVKTLLSRDESKNGIYERWSSNNRSIQTLAAKLETQVEGLDISEGGSGDNNTKKTRLAKR
jgi:hypothetical protein